MQGRRVLDLPLQGARRPGGDGRELRAGRLRSRARICTQLPELPDYRQGGCGLRYRRIGQLAEKPSFRRRPEPNLTFATNRQTWIPAFAGMTEHRTTIKIGDTHDLRIHPVQDRQRHRPPDPEPPGSPEQLHPGHAPRSARRPRQTASR
ncbi:Exonuclease SbcC [Massilia sp. 9I]|nr:Exonuclease SbcC [Massilia sp. 9I]